MRIVAWNLGHQTLERPLKAVLQPAIAALQPDVLVLNEFVDGPTRSTLRAALRNQGLTHIRASDRIGRHNQVLIASTTELDDGSVSANGLDETAASNFLSVTTGKPRIEIVGFRAPAYKTTKDKVRFWQAFDATIRPLATLPLLCIGDMNADPNNVRSAGGKILAGLRTDGWEIPDPDGEWSFARKTVHTRIDHALASPQLRIAKATYCSMIGNLRCAGPESTLYDHAPLSVDVAAAS